MTNTSRELSDHGRNSTKAKVIIVIKYSRETAEERHYPEGATNNIKRLDCVPRSRDVKAPNSFWANGNGISMDIG